MTRPAGAPDDWQDSWSFLGRTTNTEMYTDGPLLIAWPDLNTHDDGPRAVENGQAQLAYLKGRHEPGVICVFVDRIAHQDREARKVYASLGGPDTLSGLALIGGSLMSRALGSFFLGLARTAVPVRTFATYTDAQPWITELLEKRN